MKQIGQGPSVAVILMYHHLAPRDEPVEPERLPYVLEEHLFGRQLDAIAALGHRVSTVGDWMRRRSDPATGSMTVIPTFDDGDESNYTRALPALLERGGRATFFVTVGRVGERGYLTWEQVRALHRSGMEVGSHTLTHRAPASLSDAELRHELTESKRRLEDALGDPVVSLSSPTGFFNPRMSVIARETGYTSLCGGRIALATGSADPFALPRVPIKRSLPMDQFCMVVAPRLDHLARLRLKQMVRNGLKRILGPNAYLRWRKRALSVRMGR